MRRSLSSGNREISIAVTSVYCETSVHHSTG
jgi:hypothetical protein